MINNTRIAAALLCALVLLAGVFPAMGTSAESAVESAMESAEPEILSVSPDAPHNITHFLHTGDTTRTFTPSFSVLNFFDTELPFNSSTEWKNYTGYEQFAMQWYMYPATASSLSVTGIDAVIWVAGEVASGKANMAGHLYVYEVTDDLIDSLNFTGALVADVPIPSSTELFTYPPAAAMTFPIPFAHTFEANSTIRFVLTVNPGTSGGSNDQYTNVTVFWDSRNMFDSRLVMHVQNPMSIEGSWTEDANGTACGSFLPAANTNMSFNANVSDPFGAYDIEWVNLTAYDSLGAIIPALNNVSMARYYGSNYTAFSLFKYDWNYTGLPVGVYRYDVWACDQSGHTFFHYFGKLTYQPYDETLANYFSIGVFYNLTAHLNDTLGDDLVGATVKFGTLNATSNDTGWVALKVFGSGTLAVYWHAVKVNESLVAVTDDTTAYITCDVYSPSLVFVDGRGAPLPAASVFFEYPDGYRLPVIFTDASGSTGPIDQVPIGGSAASAWWRGAQVFNGPVYIDTNSQITITCTVYYLTVTALDPWGSPLTLANVVVKESVTQILLDSQTVNVTGTIVSRLPDGVYDVEVFWHGCLVGSRVGIALHSDLSIVISGTVVQVNFTAVDERGLPLVTAHIVVQSPTEVVVSALTDSNGTVHAVLPVGIFSVRGYWYGILVNSTSVTITGNANITLVCRVAYVTLRALDSRSAPVQAYVIVEAVGSRIICNAGTTDESGTLVVRLAEGDYRVSAYWMGVLVNDTPSVSLANGSTVLIGCAVYYLDCSAVDSRGAPVGGASLLFDMRGTGPEMTAVCGTDGNATVRLPVGSYNLTATWKGVLVNQTAGVAVNSDAHLTVRCLVFYLDISAMDAKGLPVENATVRIHTAVAGDFESATDQAGNATFLLPVTACDLSAYWLGTLVNGTSFNLSSGMALVLDCSVIYPRLRPIDSRSALLVGSRVEVSSGALVLGAGACSGGGFEARVPAGAWRVTASWMGTLVYDGSIQLTTSAAFDFRCSVSYLAVRATDSSGAALDGVEVGVYSSDGSLIGHARTEGGLATFRLPDQPVTMRGKLSTEYMMSHIDATVETAAILSGDSEAHLAFGSYPPPIYSTNLFLLACLGAVCAALAIAIAILAWKLKRLGKAPAPVPQAAAEPPMERPPAA